MATAAINEQTKQDAPAPPSNDPRERLKGMVKAAGWDKTVLIEIRDAALGGGRGVGKEGEEPLPDVDILEICRAADILIDAGRTGSQVITRIRGFRDAAESLGDWRYEFWRAEMTVGAERYNEAQRRQAQAAARPAAVISRDDRTMITSLAEIAALSNAALTNTLRSLQQHPPLPESEAGAALAETLETFDPARLAAALSHLRTLGAAELRHLHEMAEQAHA